MRIIIFILLLSTLTFSKRAITPKAQIDMKQKQNIAYSLFEKDYTIPEFHKDSTYLCKIFQNKIPKPVYKYKLDFKSPPLRALLSVKDGKLNGVSIWFYSKGGIEKIEQYKDGKRNGVRIEFTRGVKFHSNIENLLRSKLATPKFTVDSIMSLPSFPKNLAEYPNFHKIGMYEHGVKQGIEISHDQAAHYYRRYRNKNTPYDNIRFYRKGILEKRILVVRNSRMVIEEKVYVDSIRTILREYQTDEKSVGKVNDSVSVGSVMYRYSKGFTKTEVKRKNGKHHGKKLYYDEKGKLDRVVDFDNGKEKSWWHFW